MLSQDVHSEITTELLNNEFAHCSFVTAQNSSNDFLWISTILQIIDPTSNLRSKGIVNVMPNLDQCTNEELRIWIKIAIYFNQTPAIQYILEKVHPEFLEDKKIRELLGSVYYRQEKMNLAQSFIQNVHTANTANIRGNIQLKNKKYELAYGH
ncbi:MAG: hypothetical protein HQK53_18725, partial [Oligoflexia bacterium]|nr:hypothetical protein [Oligoflexia bacterium]